MMARQQLADRITEHRDPCVIVTMVPPVRVRQLGRRAVRGVSRSRAPPEHLFDERLLRVVDRGRLGITLLNWS
jgi:hypothetical protein